MSYERFSEDELEVKEVSNVRGNQFEWFNTPITSRENFLRIYQGKTPMWIPITLEMVNIKPDCDPENVARSPKGGIDGWGVEWQWEGIGAMVRPGNPLVKDIEHWEDYVTPPDPDKWDWEACYERTKKQLRPDRFTMVSTGSCLFERLIAVMDFDNAAVALVDEDEQEHVHRFFRAVVDSRKKWYTQAKKWFNPDIANWNDDWGTQRAEMFSVDTAKEMLVPYVKEVGDLVHSLGMYFDLHCCGRVEKFVPFFIEEGFNSWGGQALNDKYALKQKYGDKMIFSHMLQLKPGYTQEDIDAAVEQYMSTIGEDNRVLYNCPPNLDPRVHRALYVASRKNFDRLVKEGRAIL